MKGTINLTKAVIGGETVAVKNELTGSIILEIIKDVTQNESITLESGRVFDKNGVYGEFYIETEHDKSDIDELTNDYGSEIVDDYLQWMPW